MLESVFRSIIDVKKGDRSTIDQEDLVRNFRSFQKSRVAYEEDAYHAIYYKILDHYKNFSELPDHGLLVDHFSEIDGKESALAALDRIKPERPWLSSNYQSLLKKVENEQSQDRFQAILKESHEIMVSGKKAKKGKKKLLGLDDALNYVIRYGRDLQQRNVDIKLEGQIVAGTEVKEVLDEYDKMKSKQTEAVGVYTGLAPIDDICKGLKHTEFMLIAAYVGQLKTTLCLNMAYKAIYAGWNSALISLEMSYDEMRRMLMLLHSCNPIFLETEWADLVGTIDYNDFTYGDLSTDQENFMRHVLHDWETNPEYGKMFLWQPDQSITTPTDIDLKLREFNSVLVEDEDELEFVIIDYISLLGIELERRSRDTNENLNQIIKSLKRLCLSFNNGQGLRMVSPFQVSRAGYNEAVKNEGRYNLTALSNAHEAERSADVVISLFMDDNMKQSGQVRVCCLKNRRNGFFNPFEAAVNFMSRFIYDMVTSASDFHTPINVEDIGS